MKTSINLLTGFINPSLRNRLLIGVVALNQLILAGGSRADNFGVTVSGYKSGPGAAPYSQSASIPYPGASTFSGSDGDTRSVAVFSGNDRLVFDGEATAEVGAGKTGGYGYAVWTLSEVIRLRFPDLSPEFVAANPLTLEGAFRMHPTVQLEDNQYGADANFEFDVTWINGDPLTPPAVAAKYIATGYVDDKWTPVTAYDRIPADGMLRFRTGIGAESIGLGKYEVTAYFRVAMRVQAQVVAAGPKTPEEDSIPVIGSAKMGKVTWQKPRVLDKNGNEVAFGRVFSPRDLDLSDGSEPKPPKITTEPADISGITGQEVVLSVQSTGDEPLSYQWFRANPEVELPGQTGATLTLKTLTLGDSGGYFVKISNEAGNITSRVAQLTVRRPPASVKIELHPGIVVSGEVGASYRIEYSSDPAGPNWEKLMDIELSSSPQLFYDPTSIGDQAKRYYRAVEAAQP